MVEHHTPLTYYLPKVEIKDCNVVTDGRNFFDQAINSMNKTYENIRIIATGKVALVYNWLLVRLSLFQKKLQNGCNRCKQTK